MPASLSILMHNYLLPKKEENRYLIYSKAFNSMIFSKYEKIYMYSYYLYS